MKATLRAGGLVGTMMAMLVASSLLFAQETKKGAKADPKPATAAKKASNRLPNNYGKLDLSDEQRTKVLAVQAAHAAKIADLQAQLDAAKAKQTAEIDAILTPDQLKELTEIRAESKKKQAADKAEKAKSAEKKPAEKK